DLDERHMMHRMLNVIDEFAREVGLDGDKFFFRKIIADLQAKGFIIALVADELADGMQGIKSRNLAGFDKLVVRPFVVVDNTGFETVFKAEKKFECVADMLSDRGHAQGFDGS